MGMTEKMLEDALDDFIIKSYPEADGKRSMLLNHERKTLCVKNLVNEINMGCLKNPKLFARPGNIELILASFCKMFCEAAIREKEESMMSASEKERQRVEHKKAEYVKELAQAIDDKNIDKMDVIAEELMC